MQKNINNKMSDISLKRILHGKALAAALAVTFTLTAVTGCGFSERTDSTAGSPTAPATRASEPSAADTDKNSPNSSSQAAQSPATAAAAAESTAANRTMGVCGLYIYDEDAGVRRFVDKTYTSTWEKGKDIMCFEVFNTREAALPGKVFKYMWEPVWFTPDDASKYRIGYAVDFKLKDGTSIHKMLLEPDDTLEYKKYMEFYMYDDYHQTPGVWYSHVEQKAYTKDTILTSVKFTAGQEYDSIDGKVKLTAFIYDPDANQFDAAGNYTGNAYYSIDVVNR